MVGHHGGAVSCAVSCNDIGGGSRELGVGGPGTLGLDDMILLGHLRSKRFSWVHQSVSDCSASSC